MTGGTSIEGPRESRTGRAIGGVLRAGATRGGVRVAADFFVIIFLLACVSLSECGTT